MNRTAKITIGVLSTLLALAMVWILKDQVEAARRREHEREVFKEWRVAQDRLNEEWAAQPKCPPCDAGAL